MYTLYMQCCQVYKKKFNIRSHRFFLKGYFEIDSTVIVIRFPILMLYRTKHCERLLSQ